MLILNTNQTSLGLTGGCEHRGNCYIFWKQWRYLNVPDDGVIVVYVAANPVIWVIWFLG